MRFAATLPLAAVAAAIVLPDAKVFHELEREVQESRAKVAEWWDSARVPTKEDLLYAAGDAIDIVSHSVHDAFAASKHGLELLLAEEASMEEEEADEEADDVAFEQPDERGRGGPGHHHKKKPPHHTIWQLIEKSEHTKTLAKLVGEYDDLVAALNGTSANFTLFAPTEEAFKRIPHRGGDKKPPREFVEKVLKYHVVTGFNPALRVLHRHTLPTALEEPWLGDHPQRLRVRLGLRGLRVNFFSKVVYPNIFATNGVIHAVDNILVPPPMVGRILSLLPQRFSTLLLAFEKTDFADYIHKIPMAGSTVFAPSNEAFSRLGPRANAFLFNTETGKKYLKAILKYHIVANQTLYSDAYYSAGKGGPDEGEDATATGHYHVDLPTLLDDTSVAVDVARWGGFIRLRVNGYVPVVVQDGVAKNGVIQVVGRVLIPPHKHHKPGGDGGDVDGEISVEALKERLDGYLEGDDGGEAVWGEL